MFGQITLNRSTADIGSSQWSNQFPERTVPASGDGISRSVYSCPSSNPCTSTLPGWTFVSSVRLQGGWANSNILGIGWAVRKGFDRLILLYRTLVSVQYFTTREYYLIRAHWYLPFQRHIVIYTMPNCYSTSVCQVSRHVLLVLSVFGCVVAVSLSVTVFDVQ